MIFSQITNSFPKRTKEYKLAESILRYEACKRHFERRLDELNEHVEYQTEVPEYKEVKVKKKLSIIKGLLP